MPSSKMLLTVLALGASVSAFTVPEGQGDGVYTFDPSSGNHVKVRDLAPLSRVYRSRTPEHRDTVERRETETGCGDGILTSDDLTGAVNALNGVCASEPIIHKGSHAYAISGGAVAYMCNYAGDNPCAATEFNDAVGAIEGACPNNRAGWSWIKDWGKSYGYDTIRGNICNGGV